MEECQYKDEKHFLIKTNLNEITQTIYVPEQTCIDNDVSL